MTTTAFWIYTLVVTILAFLSFFLDKQLVKLAYIRIPEMALLMLTAMGGAVGSCLAMLLFHHKTNFKRKWYFWVVTVVGLMAVGLLAFLALVQPEVQL